MMDTKDMLMKKIREYDFTLKELNLYLDTHPDCKRGLAMFRKCNILREEALREYNENYGPITPEQCNDTQHWQWADGPFPWEV